MYILPSVRLSWFSITLLGISIMAVIFWKKAEFSDEFGIENPMVLVVFRLSNENICAPITNGNKELI